MSEGSSGNVQESTEPRLQAILQNSKRGSMDRESGIVVNIPDYRNASHSSL